MDTGATRSVLTQCLAPPSRHSIEVQGATGSVSQRPFLQPLQCTTKGKTITHQFVYMPDCPIPLLGRDLLSKLRAQISFEEDSSMNMSYGKVTMEVPQEEAWRMMIIRKAAQESRWKQFEGPELWAEDNPPGFASHKPPIIVEELPMKKPVRIPQRPHPRSVVFALQKIIQQYLDLGIVVPIQSQWKTPTVPIP